MFPIAKGEEPERQDRNSLPSRRGPHEGGNFCFCFSGFPRCNFGSRIKLCVEGLGSLGRRPGMGLREYLEMHWICF